MISSKGGIFCYLAAKQGFFRSGKLYVLYVAQIVLLVCIAIVCAISFGYNVSNFSHVNTVIYDSKTCNLLTSCVLLLSYQPVFFGTEAASASANEKLISLVDELEHRKRVGINFVEFRENMDVMFEYGPLDTVEDSFKALRALEVLTLRLTHARSMITNRNFNPSYVFFIGYQCVAKQLYQTYFSNALLQKVVYPLWGSSEYALYSGFVYNNLSFPHCSRYLSGPDKLVIFAESGCSLSGAPSLAPQYVKSPLGESDILLSLEMLEVEINQLQSLVTDYYDMQLLESSLITMYSLAGLILSCCFAALSPFFFTKGFQRHTETLRRYKKLEESLRFLIVYSSSIATLKDEQRLYHIFFGTFLLKLVGFMGRARPFLPQTAFGDIESIILSSSDNWTIEGISASEGVLSHTSEDEHGTQELRTEVGLQLALGTVMCVSIKKIFTDSDIENVGSKLCTDMSSAVGLIERIANSHHGAIHSISSRYVFIVWNINSSCAHHEVEAITTGLEIISLLDRRSGEISISIGSSLVVAGTVEESLQRTVIICGPAMVFCQKAQLLNRYHRTSIVLDKRVASKVFSLSIAGEEYCAVPISLFRIHADKAEYQVAYGLFNSRLTEPLKAWSNIFKRFPSWLDGSSLIEMQTVIREYRMTFLNSTDRYSSVTLDSTVEFWETMVHALKH